jgi:hypothetical protein
MRKSEINFILMIIVFIIGLTNIFPSEISIYDQYVIPIIQENTTPEHIFYSHITLLIIIFRILIIFITIMDLVVLLKYALRYNIFGLRQILTK